MQNIKRESLLVIALSALVFATVVIMFIVPIFNEYRINHNQSQNEIRKVNSILKDGVEVSPALESKLSVALPDKYSPRDVNGLIESLVKPVGGGVNSSKPAEHSSTTMDGQWRRYQHEYTVTIPNEDIQKFFDTWERVVERSPDAPLIQLGDTALLASLDRVTYSPMSSNQTEMQLEFHTWAKD